MSSLVSAKGPSVIDGLRCARKLTRLPNLLGLSPSAALRMPAFTISSLKRIPRSMSSLLGITPASLFALAFKITRTRIVFLLEWVPKIIRFDEWTIGPHKDRHQAENPCRKLFSQSGNAPGQASSLPSVQTVPIPGRSRTPCKERRQTGEAPRVPLIIE